MNLKIDRTSCVPLYQQISRKIEAKILSHELAEGFKLPSERRLAEETGVHRNTVIKAYDALIAKGLVVVSRKKPKGYFVRASREEQHFGSRFFPLEKAFRYEFRKAEKTFNELYYQSERENIISMAGMIMDRGLNPVTGMEHVTERIFDSSQSGFIQGFNDETERLRRNICGLLTEENIYVTSKNVQILAESNQIISYLTMLYLREGDCIVAEGPMVPDIFSIFYNRGIRVVTVPMEKDGMRMDMLEEAIRSCKPRFIYTIPSYHNPTGITMSLKKRQTLLRLADEYNVPVIEEDYLRDFSYEEKRLPSLYALDQNRLVIYVYSYTLIFPYMTKIGYAVGPADLIDMLGYALSIDETAVSSIGQYFLNEYIESGELRQHISIVQQVYRRKRDLLCSELDRIAYKGISYQKPEGGLLVWCTLDDDISERELCRIASEKGLLIIPGWIFYTDDRKKKGHIRLCFSNITDDKIRSGISLLGEALDECRAQKNNKQTEEDRNNE